MRTFYNSSTPNIIRETTSGYNFIHLEDEMMVNREIFLVDEINTASMESIIKQIMFLYRENPEKEITLYISSPGGEVVSGLAIYDTMKLIKAPVHTVCVGTVASMGAILFLAGERRSMMPHSRLIVHDPYTTNSMVSRKLDLPYVENTLAGLRNVQQTIRQIVRNITGLPEQELAALMLHDTCLDAEAAVRSGFATDIITSM